jgi:hypothetical protein
MNTPCPPINVVSLAVGPDGRGRVVTVAADAVVPAVEPLVGAGDLAVVCPLAQAPRPNSATQITIGADRHDRHAVPPLPCLTVLISTLPNVISLRTDRRAARAA